MFWKNQITSIVVDVTHYALLQLLQELEGHRSHVNTIAFDEEGSRLFSGDSLGAIRMWNAFVTDKPSSRGLLKDWTLNREILDGEIKV